MNNIKFIGSLFACAVTRIGTRAIVAMLLLASPLLGGCATPYYSKPFGGQVVDALSGKPMEGVIVLAAWDLEHSDSGKGVGTLEQMEAVTDRDGHFGFEGWGPVEIPQPANSRLRIRPEAPRVLAFKPGYEFAGGDVATNGNFGGGTSGFSTLNQPFNSGPSVREAKMYGPIKMKLFLRSEKEYFSLWESRLIATGNCLWTKVPRMIAALIKEERRGEAKYPGSYRESRFIGYIDKDPRATKCGSFEHLIEPYLK